MDYYCLLKFHQFIASGLVNVKKCKEGTKGFAMLGSVPEPFTWYENIKSLKAGHYLIIRNNKIEL